MFIGNKMGQILVYVIKFGDTCIQKYTIYTSLVMDMITSKILSTFSQLWIKGVIKIDIRCLVYGHVCLIHYKLISWKPVCGWIKWVYFI